MTADRTFPGVSSTFPIPRRSRWEWLERASPTSGWTSGGSCASDVVLGNVFAHDAFVPLQLPLMVRAIGEPIGNADLPLDRTGRHGDSRLLSVGDDFLQAQLAVAENGDESNEHGVLRLS